MILPNDGSADNGSAERPLAPGPFSQERPVCPLSQDALESRLKGSGIRLMPYPFESAIAVASDVDGSDRNTFDGYTRMLVHELGLDFGDSAWLHWRYVFNSEGRRTSTNSGGFLSPSLTERAAEPAKFFSRNRTFFEMLSAYHEGNVDHYHALLPHGPRIAVLTNVSRNGDLLTVDIPPLDASCADFHVFGICLAFAGEAHPGIYSVQAQLAERGESADYGSADHDHPVDGNSYLLFIRNVDPEGSDCVPHLRDVSRIVVKTDDRSGPLPARVMLISSFGPILLDRLGFLRDKYNVEMPLVTEHAKLHFRIPAATDRLRALNASRYQAQANSLIAFTGPLLDSSGQLIATVDPDEPHSFARVLPEAIDQGELRFIVPAPASAHDGFCVTDLLAASPTRSGGGFYWAKRTMPDASAAAPGRIFDPDKTRQDTFGARVLGAVESATNNPGTFWPIYTHLGSLPRVDGRRVAIPDPYFEPAPLLTLQDRVLGITAEAPAKGRIWCARASTLYDYALILQSVAEHVERINSRSIHIRSWNDPVLGKKLPRAPSHLYGLTFYVDDEATAQVALDGEIIDHVVRNPPDSTGSPSVTVAECDISSTIFRVVDPRSVPGATLEGGEWAWVEGQIPSGRLIPTGETALSRVRVPMLGAMLPGAQLLSFRLRAERKWAGGVLVETCGGGRFWFGSSSLVAELGDITASYAIDRLLRAEEWLRIVVPFHDLSWSESARPGGPLPSHALEAVTLVSAGAAGTAADFADMRLLRPKVSRAARRPDRGHCVVGMVPEAGPGQIVRLRAAGDPRDEKTTHTDQRGWFAFANVAPGVYDVIGSTNGAEFQSARGATVEVWSDIGRLELGQMVPRDTR